MRTIKYISAAALLLAVSACSNEEDLNSAYTNDPDAVHINATVGDNLNISRSNPIGTEEEQAKFNSGDQIGVAAGTQTAIKYKYDGTTWTPVTTGEYLKWETTAMDFSAYYPVGDGISMEAFTLPTDQSTLDKLTAADYMTCTATDVAKADNISLSLVRRTARIVISSIAFNDQFKTGYTVSDIKVGGNTTGYTGGAVQAGSVQVTAYTAATDSKRYALLTPNTADATATFLTLTVKNTADGTTQELSVKGIPALEAGKSYTYSLTVGKNMVQIGNVTVESWTDGTAIPGGEAATVIVDAATHTVTLRNAGTLTDAAIAAAISTDGALNIAGSMNDADFTTLREWADKQITDNAAKKLVTIDLSAVTGLTALPGEAFSPYKLDEYRKLAYVGLSSLKSVTLPDAVIEIGDGAFANCSNLTSINLGKVQTIGAYAFGGCSSLTGIDLSAATSIGAAGFISCSSLGIIDAPVLQTLNSEVFSTCGTVSAVNLPEVTTCATDTDNVPSLAFDNLNVTGDIRLPKCTYLMKSMFADTSVAGGLYLTTSENITMSDYTFYFSFTTAPTLYLHQNKKTDAAGDATPKVSAEGKWGYRNNALSLLYSGWKAIKYVNDAGEVVTD